MAIVTITFISGSSIEEFIPTTAAFKKQTNTIPTHPLVFPLSFKERLFPPHFSFVCIYVGKPQKKILTDFLVCFGLVVAYTRFFQEKLFISAGVKEVMDE